MYYYGSGYSSGGSSCCNQNYGYQSYPAYGYGYGNNGGFGYGAAIILVLFILLVIIIGSRAVI